MQTGLVNNKQPNSLTLVVLILFYRRRFSKAWIQQNPHSRVVCVCFKGWFRVYCGLYLLLSKLSTAQSSGKFRERHSSCFWIRDPRSGMGKNQDPRSGINIPDPQHWEHHSINSRREIRNNKGARNSRDQPTTVLASAGTPTAQYRRQQHNMDANSTIWMLTAQFGRRQHNMDANNSCVFAEIRQKVV